MNVGARLGNFQLVQQLARGGFGTVFLAQHVESGHKVAVKILHPQWTAEREQVQRLFNEARAATLVDDPGIAKVIDFGFSPDGAAYLIMEFLSGELLSARIKRAGRMEPTAAAYVARQIARTVGKAHDAGIVHRDLKPDNIFLVPDEEVASGERVKILDFGIAKLGAVGSGTMATASFGTPLYMSPEQIRSAANVDRRADVYSLGCILFELLVGRPPFEGEAGEVIGKQQFVEPPRASAVNPDVPIPLDEVVARALKKEPGERYQSMDDLRADLEHFVRSTGAMHVQPLPVSMRLPAHPAAGRPAAPHRHSPVPLIVAGLGAVLVGGAIVAVALSSRGGSKSDKAAAAPSSMPASLASSSAANSDDNVAEGDAEAILAEAQQLIVQKDFEKARSLYSKIAYHSSASASVKTVALLGVADAELRLKDYEAARRHAKQALDGGGGVHAETIIAVAALRAGDLVVAAQHAQAILDAQPDNAEARQVLDAVHAAQGSSSAPKGAFDADAAMAPLLAPIRKCDDAHAVHGRLDLTVTVDAAGQASVVYAGPVTGSDVAGCVDKLVRAAHFVPGVTFTYSLVFGGS